ncbi:hypothetical protein [Pseudomonas syringae]|uniref:hypothetical protein n=1 Tax=Pseudomonas syringae TaxID=317 RepID=UPI000BB5CFEC|nr:hypothetical protein [Pseudomonas syringae]MCK9739057.1 hypothetical protein [Pseudomonas syringae pv. syringae]MCK9779080.1 hypothetical protein [Pseudomonas syringae pv. syringae]PBP30605.1 hypothetical protein CCL12_23255 [Pseudomonas syringae]PBP31207.1 hypothetical protein CCL12_21485 [Pseudomonas syringae]RXF64277.1 hypothetical protein BKM77_11470 [Pseudomonas syringae]
MTLLIQPGPLHRHVDHETGHILHIDPITGEIINRKEMIRPKNPEAQYQAWAAKRRTDEELYEDQQKAAKGIATVTRKEFRETPKATRGRPRTSYANPAAAYMHLLAIPDPLPWIDDIVTGSIITSAGVTNGKINVKARAVIGALFLSEITAEACKTSEISLRTAQRIAKAARHAAHGIASYVERHPRIKADIDVEALFLAS